MRPTLALLIALAAFGCGKKSDPPPAADKPDKPAADKPADKPVVDKPVADKPKGGCSYITEAEASAALGQPSKYRSNDGSENCIIDPVAEKSATTMTVDFTVYPKKPNRIDSFAKTAKPLDGIGDKAAIDGAGAMAQVGVVKGDTAVMMTLSGQKASDPAIIKAFAEKLFTHF